ncbi:MAG: sigma-70 family RNA polymerase sigma factor [Firmicutes bacterium]|nr:sigma-70 family RNA polymerase sigma factor [Bacillota bacterium]
MSAWVRELFDRHYAEVVRHVHYLTGDRALAEDIAQETFVRMYLTCPSPPEHPPSWLRRVAARLAYNELRAGRRRERREAAYAAAASPAEREWEPASDLREALERLDPRDRTLLLLRAEGWAYREIADVVGVDAASVGTLLARARRRLAARLNGVTAEVNPKGGGAS